MQLFYMYIIGIKYNKVKSHLEIFRKLLYLNQFIIQAAQPYFFRVFKLVPVHF